jgi:hypothetical protein
MNRIAAAGVAIAVVLLAIGAQATAAPAPRSQPASIPDNASASDVMSLQRAVPGIMTDWIAAGRADGEVGDVDQFGMVLDSLSADAVSTRRQLLAGILTPRLVEPELGHFGDQFWSALFRLQASSIYVGNRFEVAEWNGIQVLGDVARVVVSARQDYTFPNGTEGAEPWHSYLLVLQRDPQARYGWLLIERSASQVPRAGSDSRSDR